jgi:hypothetical protein
MKNLTNNNLVEESLKLTVEEITILSHLYVRIEQTYPANIHAWMEDSDLEYLKENYLIQKKSGQILGRILQSYMDHKFIWKKGEWDEDTYLELIHRKAGNAITLEIAEDGLAKIDEMGI